MEVDYSNDGHSDMPPPYESDENFAAPPYESDEHFTAPQRRIPENVSIPVRRMSGSLPLSAEGLEMSDLSTSPGRPSRYIPPSTPSVEVNVMEKHWFLTGMAFSLALIDLILGIFHLQRLFESNPTDESGYADIIATFGMLGITIFILYIMCKFCTAKWIYHNQNSWVAIMWAVLNVICSGVIIGLHYDFIILAILLSNVLILLYFILMKYLYYKAHNA
ncbi:hypothetical protein Ahia01_000121900 [Argonauta hians]